MRTAARPAEPRADDDAPPGPPGSPRPPAMTACACTGRPFAEVALRMRREGLSMAEAESLTGCGSICTACLPDLRSFLRRRARPLTSVPEE